MTSGNSTSSSRAARSGPAGTQLSATQVDEVLSTTARFTADAPFQAISDGTYVYVFRQSITPQSDPALMVYEAPDGTLAYTPGGSNVPLVNGTLLVDRFVLVGTELQSTREVRYQRSRSKTRPQSNKDSLGASDLEGRPFVEPTQALSFISGMRAAAFLSCSCPPRWPRSSAGRSSSPPPPRR